MTFQFLSVFLCILHSRSLKLVKVGEEPSQGTSQDPIIPPGPLETPEHPEAVYRDFVPSDSDAQYNISWARAAGLFSTEAEEAMQDSLKEMNNETSEGPGAGGSSRKRKKKGYWTAAVCPPICYNRIVLMYQWKAMLKSCQWHKCYGGDQNAVTPYTGGVFLKIAKIANSNSWKTCEAQGDPTRQACTTDTKNCWFSYSIPPAELNGASPVCGTCYTRNYCHGVMGEAGAACYGSYGVEFRKMQLTQLDGTVMEENIMILWASKAECLGRNSNPTTRYFPFRYKDLLTYPSIAESAATTCTDKDAYKYYSGSTNYGSPPGNNDCSTCTFTPHSYGPWGFSNLGMPQCELPVPP